MIKKIKIINPNPDINITKIINKLAKNIIHPKTQIITTRNINGMSEIKNYYNKSIYKLNKLKKIQKKEKIKRFVISCFRDYELPTARELTKYPIINITKNSVHITSLIHINFSILTTLL